MLQRDQKEDAAQCRVSIVMLQKQKLKQSGGVDSWVSIYGC